MKNKIPLSPRLVIAGTHSGCGKTTITTALMASFFSLGRRVIPFKIGPDFIDPSFHEFVTGTPSYSLDSWLLPEQTVQQLFLLHTQQRSHTQAPLSTKDAPFLETNKKPPLAIIEGVMGLYDGQSNTSVGSTAHVATILHSPTLLVVDGQGMSLSAAALVAGYAHFRSEHSISGVIFNKLSGEKHYKLLANIIHNETGIPCFGFMPRNQEVMLRRRHLGLIPSSEVEDLTTRIQSLISEAKRFLDLTSLAKLAESLPFPEEENSSPKGCSSTKECGSFTELTLCPKQKSVFAHDMNAPQEEELLVKNISSPDQEKASPEAISSLRESNPLTMSSLCQERDNASSGERTTSQQDTVCPESIVNTTYGKKQNNAVLSHHDIFQEKICCSPQENEKVPRIGVLKDKAFSFYYHDNLEILTTLGAELVYLSPMKDTELPENLDGLYLGGGFPEVFAEELSANVRFRGSLREILTEGTPAYAECGGMMYLMEEIIDVNGRAYPMVGFFEGKARMTKKRGPFGYITVELLQNSVLGATGISFRAHEFHHSCIDSGFSPVASMKKENGESWQGGMIKKNTLAWYPHIHFYSFPELAKNFVHTCIQKNKSVLPLH